MNPKTDPNSPRVRVFANDKGQVILTVEREKATPSVQIAPEKANNIQVELPPPITWERLQTARQELLELKEAKKEKERKDLIAAMPSSRQEANRQIELALDPIGKGRWLERLKYLSGFVLLRLFAFWIVLLTIGALYKFVQYSSEHFPALVHFGVLGLYVGFMAYLLFLISGENPTKYSKHMRVTFGPYALLVIPFILVGSAAAVLASITIRLYGRGSVILETCSGRVVSEAGLMDFYVWHFVNIVPLLQITNLIRWGEPYCYKQSRVGLLILLFQLAVVLPSLNAIRRYWQNRKIVSGLIFDPRWNPETD